MKRNLKILVSGFLLFSLMASSFLQAPIPAQATNLSLTWQDAGVPDTRWFGDGTADTYVINTAEELAGLAQLMNRADAMELTQGFEGRVVLLNNDIDLSGRLWIPIGYEEVFSYRFFKGEFLGNAHTIRGMTVHTSDQAGLFHRLQKANIAYFSLAEVSLQGTTFVGALASEVIESTVIDVFVDGSVIGSGDGTGGLIGLMESTIISNSAFQGEVIGTNFVGGLVGQSILSTDASGFNLINESSFKGTVSGLGPAGGFVGGSIGGLGILNSAVQAAIQVARSEAGGFVGLANQAAFDNVIFEGEIEGAFGLGGVVGFLEQGAIRVARVNANIKAYSKETSQSGGLAGSAYASTFNEFVVEGTLEGDAGALGGVVGFAKNIDMDDFEVKTTITTSVYGAGLLAGYLEDGYISNGDLRAATVISDFPTPLMANSTRVELNNVLYDTDTVLINPFGESSTSDSVLMTLGIGMLISLVTSALWLIKKKKIKKEA